MKQNILKKSSHEIIDKNQTKKTLTYQFNSLLKKQIYKNKIKSKANFIFSMFLFVSSLCILLYLFYIFNLNYNIGLYYNVFLFLLLNFTFISNYILIKQYLFTNYKKQHDRISITLLICINVFTIVNTIFIIFNINLSAFIIFNTLLLAVLCYPIYYLTKICSIEEPFRFYFKTRYDNIIYIEDNNDLIKSFSNLIVSECNFKMEEQHIFLKMFNNKLIYNEKKNKHFLFMSFFLDRRFK